VAPVQYDQMRRLPLAEAATTLGSNRTLFRLGTVQLATVLGFESIVGDHVRRFTQDGANVILVLAQNDWWGRSGGYYQHMGVTRLRAVENRRAVVMSTMSGGTTIFQPTGETTEASGWMEQGLVPLDVPIYRAQTIYAAHGDWVGLWALWIAVLGHIIAFLAARVIPQEQPAPRRMAIPFR
jgi:apolipoprotein N-acyltransferase